MLRQVIHANIVEVPSDAMIYSTNPGLTLTGGVGAALLRKYGIQVQHDLHRAAANRVVVAGDVFQTVVPEGPWRTVFHTVASNELYHVDVEVVQSILTRCFRACVERGDVRSITCSALGTGYGDLTPDIFVSIAEGVCREFDHTQLSSFAIVSHELSEYKSVCEAVASLGGWMLSKSSEA